MNFTNAPSPSWGTSLGQMEMPWTRPRCLLSWSGLCPKPSINLQWFLDFANFYCLFIKIFSAIAHPLTSLLKKGTKHLVWNPSVEADLSQLKTAPILNHPNLSKQFIVDVAPSKTGIRSILFQCFGEKPSFTMWRMSSENSPKPSKNMISETGKC